MELLKRRETVGVTDAPPLCAISVVRNERTRLPAFLRHYRALKVRDFIFVDNDSNDGTRDYLMEQRDTTVFHTRGPYGDPSTGKTAWINSLARQYAHGRWCLVADADELLVFDDGAHDSLPAFVAHVQQTGAKAVFGVLLDMYPPDGTPPGEIDPERPLAEQAPLFDADYRFSTLPRDSGLAFPYLSIAGGPRWRLYRSATAGTLPRKCCHAALQHLAFKARRALPSAAAALEHRFLLSPPMLSKIPLFFVDGQITITNGAHFCSPTELYERNAVVLHFKIMSDYVARLAELAANREHWNAGVEQRWLLRQLRRSQGLSLEYAGSTRIEDTKQLARLGLIRDLAELHPGQLRL